MAAKTDSERITTLEAQVQALVEDYAEQVYGHVGPVEWHPEAGGWLRVVARATDEEIATANAALREARVGSEA